MAEKIDIMSKSEDTVMLHCIFLFVFSYTVLFDYAYRLFIHGDLLNATFMCFSVSSEF